MWVVEYIRWEGCQIQQGEKNLVIKVRICAGAAQAVAFVRFIWW